MYGSNISANNAREVSYKEQNSCRLSTWHKACAAVIGRTLTIGTNFKNKSYTLEYKGVFYVI